MRRFAISIAIAATLSVGPLATVATRANPSDGTPDLHKMLMDKFDAMNTRSEGIFHEDVTPAVEPYFPVGQPIEETRQIIAKQHLGNLKPFKGTNDPGMGSMYVTKFDLSSHLFSHVYVVLDFDFDGPADAMKLTHMKAFLRASNM